MGYLLLMLTVFYLKKKLLLSEVSKLSVNNPKLQNSSDLILILNYILIGKEKILLNLMVLKNPTGYTLRTLRILLKS
jgi:hypothetical protein